MIENIDGRPNDNCKLKITKMLENEVEKEENRWTFLVYCDLWIMRVQTSIDFHMEIFNWLKAIANYAMALTIPFENRMNDDNTIN